MLNDGYALSVNENRDRRVFQYDYGFASVWDAVTHPGAAIERGGGLSLWLRREIFPLTFTPGKAKWYTNYTGHLIEGGIMARRSMEWFRARGVPWPALWGGLVRVATSLLNEFYEMGGQTVGSAATVADLFVFDLGGILLFANDGVSRFFARTFNANIWPGQASITVPEGEIHNNASRLIVKIPWGVIPNTSLFYWTGIGAQGGLTFHRRDGLNVTVAMGADAKRMNIDPVTGEETVGLVYSAGVFVDRDNSLLASLNISAVEDRMITVNVFPGVIPLAGGSFGAWAEMTRAGKVRFGISSRYWLGAAIGFGGF